MVSEQRNPSGTIGVPSSNILSPKWNLSMKSPACLLTVILMTALVVACSSEPWPIASSSTPALSSTAAPTSSAQAAAITPSLPAVRTAVATSQCAPTLGDELSPSYKPDAPVRSVVGQGHILTGIVRSSVNCAPIPNVKLELWPEMPKVGHPDEYRSTVFTDSSGAYRFECNPTDHIHMRISAQGYVSIASNAYHPEGKSEGVFNIVLEPDKP